jgi:mono/diheme cytochrome c family protein
MRFRLIAGAVAIGLAGVALNVGCAHKAAGPSATMPAATPLNNASLTQGQRTFMQYCNQCHVGGNGGIGPSFNDKWMPAFFIRFKVRHGIGKMPRFSDRAVSDTQLDDVIQYISYMKAHPHDVRG